MTGRDPLILFPAAAFPVALVLVFLFFMFRAARRRTADPSWRPDQRGLRYATLFQLAAAGIAVAAGVVDPTRTGVLFALAMVLLAAAAVVARQWEPGWTPRTRSRADSPSCSSWPRSS